MRLFPLWAHLSPCTWKKYVSSHACVFLRKRMAYVSIPLHMYISFLLKSVCMTAVSLDHLCTLCMIVPVLSSSKWSCLVRQTVEGRGWGLSRNAALCIVCKNKPSGQRYSQRIYIKQLQKQASVCGLVMQQDHTTSLTLISFQDREREKSEEKSFDCRPHWHFSQNEKILSQLE